MEHGAQPQKEHGQLLTTMTTNKIYVVTTHMRGTVTRRGGILIFDNYQPLPETRKQMNDVVATLLIAKRKYTHIIAIKTTKV